MERRKSLQHTTNGHIFITSQKRRNKILEKIIFLKIVILHTRKE